MTPVEIKIATALSQCSFLPASWDKRFCRGLGEQAKNRPNLALTERQIAHMLRLTHKYRRQLDATVSQLRADMARRHDDLSREMICGASEPPEPKTLAYRNGQFVELSEDSAPPSHTACGGMIRLDAL